MYTTIFNDKAIEYRDGLQFVAPAPAGFPDGVYHTSMLEAGIPAPAPVGTPPLGDVTSRKGRRVTVATADLLWLAETMSDRDDTRPEIGGIWIRQFELVSYDVQRMRVVHLPIMLPKTVALTREHVEAFLDLLRVGGDMVELEVGDTWAALHDPIGNRSVYGLLRTEKTDHIMCGRLISWDYKYSQPYHGAAVPPRLRFNPVSMEGAPDGLLHYTDDAAGHVRVNSIDGRRVQSVALKGDS